MKYGPMVNVLYDMTNLLAQTTGLTIPYFAPYVGVGVGYQWAHLSGFTASGSTGFPSVASNDTYGAIAYQFILGGAVPIPSVRGLAMTVEYFSAWDHASTMWRRRPPLTHQSHSARRNLAMTSIIP